MKNKKVKKYIFFILILFLSIGFAVLTTNLSINGLFNFTPNTWNIYLDNVVVDENSTTTELPTINGDKDTLSFTSTLNKPGDYYAFNVDVRNDSTIDAMLGSITITGLDEVSDYLDCIVTYSNGTTPNPNDILYKTARVTFNIKLVYKDITKEQIPSEVLTPTVTVTINYRQANNNAVVVSDINHWNFDYIGSFQEFSVPMTGNYKIELWGSQGGDVDINTGGYGGYTSGEITIDENRNLYFYVGSKGIGGTGADSFAGGYNGGGHSGGQGGYNNKRWFSSGGGSTDVRLTNGPWDDFDSLKSRLMVAGAGGGTYKDNPKIPKAGSAGGLIGYTGEQLNVEWSNGTGGVQTLGGYTTCNVDYCGGGWSETTYGEQYYGGFGYGGISSVVAAPGGGSGYYGGGAALHAYNGAGGGSSFISGHAGCVAVTKNSTADNITFVNDSNGVTCNDSSSSGYNVAGYNTDVACSRHYSGKVFTNTVMIDGKGYQWTTTKGSEVVGMPNKNGIGKVIGNTGNGFAKITYMG